VPPVNATVRPNDDEAAVLVVVSVFRSEKEPTPPEVATEYVYTETWLTPPMTK